LVVKIIYCKLPTCTFDFWSFTCSSCVSSLTIERSNLCFGSFCDFSLTTVTYNICYSNMTTLRSNVGSSILISFESWSSLYVLQFFMKDLRVTLLNRFDMLREWKWIDKKLFVYMFRTLWTCYCFGENVAKAKLGGIWKCCLF
jgi:hypothetical protein